MKIIRQKRKNNPVFCEIIGVHSVKAALLNSERRHQKLFISNTKKNLFDEKITKLVPQINELNNKEMNKLFGNETSHQGVVLITSKLIQPKIDEVISRSKQKKSDIIVILDQVTDPNNIGSIIRSCALFNCKSVIVSKDNAPELNANIAKAASGALEIVNYISVVNLSRTIVKFKKNNYWIYGFDSSSNSSEKIINIAKKSILVFGSEGKGLRNLTKKECDALISIPMEKQKKYNLDSLNVSNACSIALFEHFKKNG